MQQTAAAPLVGQQNLARAERAPAQDLGRDRERSPRRQEWEDA